MVWKTIMALCAFLWTGTAFGVELSRDELEKLDAPESRYKVSPEMEKSFRELLAPFDLDALLPGGYVLEEISIERFYIRLKLERQANRADFFQVYVLPPIVGSEQGVSTRSFKLLGEGNVDPEAMTALVSAIQQNDTGNFWPKAPLHVASGGRKVPPSARKVHFTELMGDFFIVLFVIFTVMGFGGFKKEFSGRPLTWWWVLLGVITMALGARIVSFFLLSGEIHAAPWTPSTELGHVSVAWYLNTVSRFAAVTLDVVAMLNVLAGTATVLGVYLLSSMLFPGILPSFLAGLFTLTWPAHLALSAGVSVMVPFAMFLVWALLCQLVYVRQRDMAVHMLGVLFFLSAVFGRPEGIVIAAALMVVPFVKVPWREWLAPHFWVPVGLEVAIMAIRAATLGSGPEYPDSFLSLTVEWRAFINNLGVWLFNWSRMPLAAMVLWAVGLAARPWKRLRSETILMAVWFVLGVAVYYHVSMVDDLQGGRVSLVFLAPLAFFTASAGEFLARMRPRVRWCAVGVVTLWLAISPLMHHTSIRKEYKAEKYETNFLLEA